jgi:hypothetical protein
MLEVVEETCTICSFHHKNLQNLPPLLPQKPHRDGEGKIWREMRRERNKVGWKGKRLSKNRK